MFAELKNPLVHFYPNSPQPGLVLSLPDVSAGILEHIDTTRSDGGEYILRNGLNDDLCNSLNDVTEERDPPVFGQLPDGSWLQFDPRLKLEENTIDAHLPDGGGLVMSLTGEQVSLEYCEEIDSLCYHIYCKETCSYTNFFQSLIKD